MYDFEVNDAITEILDKSYDQKKTIEVVTYADHLLKEVQIKIKDYRWQALVNHIQAMVERSITGEKLVGIEAEMFTEVSQKAMEVAEKIVSKIEKLPKNEAYLLSIHFETAEME